MNSAYGAVILPSLLSSVTTCLGVALAISLRENTQAIATGLGFSAGIMILMSVFELVPESIAITGTRGALTSMIVSAAVVWAGHLAIPYLHSAGEKTMPNWPLKKSAYLVLLALILHDVPEGFAMANAYIASPEVGVLVAPAISLHNLPEEFAIAAPAIR